MCAFTSLLSGFVVFSVIGFLAHEFRVPIGEVMTSGKTRALSFYIFHDIMYFMIKYIVVLIDDDGWEASFLSYQ